jgi:hypothetical protein
LPWELNPPDRHELMQCDFFHPSVLPRLRQATLVFAYLLPDALSKLHPVLAHNLPRGARVVSYTFSVRAPLGLEDWPCVVLSIPDQALQGAAALLHLYHPPPRG